MMTKKYTLTITEKQARALMDACDLLQRIQLGQVREIQDNLPLKKPINYDQFHSDMRLIGLILSHHMIDNIDGNASSLGIGHPSLPESNGILYDLYKVIEHKLSWERAVEEGVVESENSPRNWNKMLGVNYDAPMHWGTEKLATMERVND